jgi:hypothetical protein
MLRKIIKTFKFYFFNIFLNKQEKNILKYISKSQYNKFQKNISIVLEMPEDYFYVISFIFLINNLKEKFNVNIQWIKINTQYQKRGFTSILKYSPFFNLKWHKLYLANGGNIGLDLDIDLINYIKYYSKAKSVFKNIESKDELIKLDYKGINVGDLIYDTYLRYKPAPTVNIKDKYLFKILISTFFIIDITIKYFKKNKFDYFFTSYTSYVHHGVLSRVALKENINIYSMGSYEILFNKINQDFPFHIKDYRFYKNIFDKLNDNFKNEIIQKSKKLLEDRFEGINDSAIFYMKNNAYSKNETDKERIFQDNKKKRVIIYMHDFYDSPHVRRWMLFPDFYEWLIFILSSLNTKEFDYYIKIHPNSNPKTVEIINNILSQLNTPVILLDKNVKSKQLIEEGFNYAITNHGTIAHELPYFNIRVLNSGDNPHINFSFSYTARSKEEFKKIIQNPTLLDFLIKPIDFKDEILRFYSMHNLISNTSDKITIEENVYLNSQIRFIENKLQLQQFNTKIQSSEYLESINLPFSKFTNHLFNA